MVKATLCLLALTAAAACCAATAAENKPGKAGGEVERLREELRAAQAQVQALARALQDAVAKNSAFRRQLAQSRERLAAAEKQIQKLAEDLGRIQQMLAKAGQDAAVATRPVEPRARADREHRRGKVTAVDNALGLVIINRGARHGVKRGTQFIVFRGSEYIGKIIIEEVFPDVSAGRYLNKDKKGDARPGDTVASAIIVQAGPGDEPPHGGKAIRGKVTGVDAKLGLAIINQGQRDGVAKGLAFHVHRRGQYIGKLIVDEIFPDVCAARYSRPDMLGDVAVGDDATTEPPKERE